MYHIDRLRETEFPLSETKIFFSHASISPLPARTKARMQEATERLATEPLAYFGEYEGTTKGDLLESLAQLVNAARPGEITPITTTSAGLNALAQAIDWQPDDNVCFCEIEFPSNAYPWLSLERDGVEVRQVPAGESGGLTLDQLAPLVDDNTRVVAASAIQFFTGHRTNLAAIGAFCRERDVLFVVDAIQAIGHMPIDVQAMNIDALASGGQKSLLAPPGVGVMYVRDEVCETLHPRAIGPNATQDYLHWLDYDLTFLEGAARFGMGTPNLVGLMGLTESVDLLQELGVANIDRHTTALAAEAIALLERLGYAVISPAGHGPIVTFKTGLGDEETDALVDYLASHNVTVVKHWDPAGVPHVRLSFHAYNTRDELRQFETILRGWKR